MSKMNNQQAGFTLIELVMVIVILGILAATALPKFVNLRGEAYSAAAQGFAGALNSAATINYAGCAAKNFTVTTDVCVKVAKCSDLGAQLNPAQTITVGALPATTVAGQLYLATDSPVATAGATAVCAAVYGNGAAGGVPFTYTAIGT